jgi:hypothetical protein
MQCHKHLLRSQKATVKYISASALYGHHQVSMYYMLVLQRAYEERQEIVCHSQVIVQTTYFVTFDNE